MEYVQIELEISENLKNNGYRLFRDDSTIVLEDSQGNQARSYIYKEWNKTTKKFEYEIEKRQMVKDKLTMQEILSCLSRNYPLLMNGKDSNGDGHSNTTPIVIPDKEEKIIELTKDLTKEISWSTISDILSTSIKKDEAPKLITFCGMLLAQTEEDQLNIGFQAESSAGKSYIPIEVSLYFPKSEIDNIAGSSPTAFFHDSGQWDNERKVILVDVKQKILIFLDMPHFQLLEKLRPMLSHDKPELHYKITDKSQKHGLRTKNVIIKGPPSVFFCSAQSNPDEQEKTRMLLLSPSTDQEKLIEAIRLSALRKSNPDEYNKRILQDPDRLWLTNRILGVRQWGILEVDIPDEGSGVCERFLREHPYLTARHQRDFPRILSFIKAHALLNCFNRQRKEGKPTTIIATQTDIDAGYALYGKIEKSNELGLSPYIYDIYETVIEPLLKPNEGISRETILKKYYETKHKMLSSETLKRDIIPQIELVGLIMQEPDPDDRRRLLVYPTLSDNTNNNNDNDNDNDKEDNRGEDGGVESQISLFWEVFDTLEDKESHRVSEKGLKQALIASGKFDASETTQTIKELIEKDELIRLEYDVLCKKQ